MKGNSEIIATALASILVPPFGVYTACTSIGLAAVPSAIAAIMSTGVLIIIFRG